jgi:hypothetical protein
MAATALMIRGKDSVPHLFRATPHHTGGIRSGRQLSNFMESLCVTGDKIN